MIEEIKLVLDSIGDLSGVALWVVGFFLVFKLVVYLSTTGAVVYLVKLAITSAVKVITREKKVIWKHNGNYWPSDTKTILTDIYDDVFSNSTHYPSEARELHEAWAEYKSRKAEK